MLTTIVQGKTGTAPGTTVLTIPHGGSLGAIPTDFDVSRAHLDYQRFWHGWVPGYTGAQLGQEAPISHEAAMEELRVLRARLATEREVADLQHTRSSRTWMIVGGLVGVAGLVVSIVALTRG
jgi:hypothetical protein